MVGRVQLVSLKKFVRDVTGGATSGQFFLQVFRLIGWMFVMVVEGAISWLFFGVLSRKFGAKSCHFFGSCQFVCVHRTMRKVTRMDNGFFSFLL